MEIDALMEGARTRDAPDVQDLLRLFGTVGEDGEGNPFIFPEEPEDGAQRHVEHDSEDEYGAFGNDE